MFVPQPSPELTPEAVLRPEPSNNAVVDSEQAVNRRVRARDNRALGWVLILGALLIAAVLVAGSLMIWG